MEVMTSAPSPSREAGFTLIELLIALTLLGMVSTLGFGGLKLGLNALAKAPVTPSEVPVLQRMIRGWLSQAAPVLLGDGGPDSVVAFIGEPDRLVWTGPLPERFAAPGLNRVALSLDQGDGSADLIMAWHPHRPDQPLEAPPTETSRPVLPGISQLRFRYFGSPGEGEPPEWSDRWEGRRDLPRVVEMSVDLPAADRRSWPVLTIALRIDDTMSRGGRR
jgi:general secretion pathway protein J